MVPRSVAAVSGAVVVVLVAFGGRYGYHRDELYFLRAGRELAWGYPDQGPLTPLIARLFDTGSVVLLRFPSAAMMGVVVVLTAVMCRRLGGSRPAQFVSAASIGTAAVVVGVGHLLSTSTVDLLIWTAVTAVVVYIARGADTRWWIAAGVLTGIGLQNKVFPVVLAGALIVSLALVGPRHLLRSRWLWVGAVVALMIWLPNLLWQNAHGWPQIDVLRSIADGGSGTSSSRVEFVVLQLGLIGPLLAPIWATGLIRLLREHRLRFIGVTYVVMFVVFLATGGKAYYLAGLYPVLLAAGAPVVTAWLARRGSHVRRAVTSAVLLVSAVASAALFLPVYPVADLHDTPVSAVNYDAGETVGWPAFADGVASVYAALPNRDGVVVLTENYGEAGAVDRYGPSRGLPPVFSGHNGYYLWGPPPASATDVIAVGFDPGVLEQYFDTVELRGIVDNRVDVNNDEQGVPIMMCSGLREPWAQVWPEFRRYG